MTPCESFLFSKNRSSILMQFVLITFFIQKYIYLLSYPPLNVGSLKITEILNTIQSERNLFKIENKITSYSHYRIFLEKYKNNWKYPKVLSLQFNLALCSNSEDLQKSCRNILGNASYKLRDNTIAAVSKRIENLKIETKKKGPPFIPNPTDINSLNLKRCFDNFANKLRYTATKQED